MSQLPRRGNDFLSQGKNPLLERSRVSRAHMRLHAIPMDQAEYDIGLVASIGRGPRIKEPASGKRSRPQRRSVLLGRQCVQPLEEMDEVLVLRLHG